MKTRKRILDKPNHSDITSSNESIWYYSESTTDNNTFSNDQQSARNDFSSVKSTNQNNQDLSKKSKRLFIVDWEIDE